nr:lupeol synthase [Tanacetum cinerariifolium]
MLWGILHNVVEHILTRWPFSKLREKAIKVTMEHVHYTDECSINLGIGIVIVLAFCLGKTLPVSKLGCVLSQDLVAFCLEDFLRFVSRPPAFCLKIWLRFVLRPPAFCLKTYCVLSQDTVAFCLKTWLRFVSRPPAFFSRLTAFYLKIVASCLQGSCVLSTFEDLFCVLGKKNEVNILKSIDEGPYQMGTVREPLAEGTFALGLRKGYHLSLLSIGTPTEPNEDPLLVLYPSHCFLYKPFISPSSGLNLLDKLKIAEGHGDKWLSTTNNDIGRQHWEFDPDAGTEEERAEIERIRLNFKVNRFHAKQSADLLMRMQKTILLFF